MHTIVLGIFKRNFIICSSSSALHHLQSTISTETVTYMYMFVEQLPRMQNVAVRVLPEAAHFSLKMTVLGELHCVVLL